jgi:predicted aspartyl protease
VIEVVLFPPQAVVEIFRKQNKQVPMTRLLGLIDTGASNSCVNDSIAKRLHLIPRDKHVVSTPNGQNEQYLYDASMRLQITGDRVWEIQLFGANLEGQPYQALIGRDILKHCTLIYNGWDNSFNVCI